MKKAFQILQLVVTLITVIVFFSACSSGKAEPDTTASETEESAAVEETFETVESVEAVSMRLARIKGDVSLTDEGKKLTPMEGQRLHDGNAVGTGVESRAGISLDDVKAAVLGEASHAELHQDGKKLAMDLDSGDMYFSVAKPLNDDETFEIRTSTMTLGIRGTSGYVSIVDDNKTVVILTSGHATITSATGEEFAIDAGQQVTILAEDTNSTEFEPISIEPNDYPMLLIEELVLDETMLEEVNEQNEGDLKGEILVNEQYKSIISHADEYEFDTAGETPTGKYYYAFGNANGDAVPMLLLAKETEGDYDKHLYIRLFQYDSESQMVDEIQETLVNESWRPEGNGRYIALDAEGSGLIEYSTSGYDYDVLQKTKMVVNGSNLESVSSERYSTSNWDVIFEYDQSSRSYYEELGYDTSLPFYNSDDDTDYIEICWYDVRKINMSAYEYYNDIYTRYGESTNIAAWNPIDKGDYYECIAEIREKYPEGGMEVDSFRADIRIRKDAKVRWYDRGIESELTLDEYANRYGHSPEGVSPKSELYIGSSYEYDSNGCIISFSDANVG